MDEFFIDVTLTNGVGPVATGACEFVGDSLLLPELPFVPLCLFRSCDGDRCVDFDTGILLGEPFFSVGMELLRCTIGISDLFSKFDRICSMCDDRFS